MKGPERLVDTRGVREQRAREILAALPEPRALQPAAYVRIRERLDSPPRRRTRPLVLSLVLVFSATAAVAAQAFFGTSRPTAQASAPTPSRSVPLKKSLPAVAPPVAPPAEQIAPLPSTVRSQRAPERAAVDDAVAESALARESKLLAQAVAALRKERQPARALALLDEYRASFPRGTLSGEASVTRVEALLALGRRAEALSLLDRLSLERHARRTELLTLRGELRGRQGRCAQAIADFDGVLSSVSVGPLAERALYGRASCRTRTADVARARHDYEAYLTRFPNGRFTRQAQAALGLRR